jgi:uncharacterized membrane protein YphA (DoxX/SURF4 family)
MVWLAIFWCAMIIVMEKVKWEAARYLVNVSILSTVLGCIGIIIGEVLKYTAAKRLYKLVPWLRQFVNFDNGRK